MSKNAEGWIRHRGWKCPVAEGTKVDVRYRDGVIHYETDALLSADCQESNWVHEEDKSGATAECDIMAYRLHKPSEQVEACSKPELKINLPGGYGEIYNAQAVEHGPIQWRDRITEIDVTTQALTTERANLVQKLASEGFALIGRAVEHEAQQPAPGRWMIGDSVECIYSNYSFITVGTVYVITGFDRNMVQFLDDDETEMEYELANFKFHSRQSA